MNIPSSIEIAAYEYVVNQDAADRELEISAESTRLGSLIKATEAGELYSHHKAQAEMYKELLFKLVRDEHQARLNGKGLSR